MMELFSKLFLQKICITYVWEGSKYAFVAGVWVIHPPAPGRHILPSAPNPRPHESFNQLNLFLVKFQSL